MVVLSMVQHKSGANSDGIQLGNSWQMQLITLFVKIDLSMRIE
jgi:hypothetical protein